MAWRGPQALGVFNQVFAFYIVISQVVVGGLQLSVLKHCSYQQDNIPECAVIASSALTLVSIAAIFVCTILFIVREVIGTLLESPSVSLGLTFAIPGLAFFALNKVLLMVLNGLRNMRAFAVFQALRYVFIVKGALAIMLFGYPGSHLPLSLTIAEVVLFITLILYTNLALFTVRISLAPDIRNWFRRHLSFGIRGFLSGVLSEMNTRVDVLMLGYFMSDTMVGIYSFASTFAEGFAQLTVIIRQNLDPILGRCFAEENMEKIRDIARKTRREVYPVMTILGGILILGFPLILWLFATEDGMWKSWSILIILATGTVLVSGYRPFIALIIQGGRPEVLTMLIACTVLGNAFLNYCFIPLFGIYGAAIATALIYIFEACAIIMIARKLFGIGL